jgi:hypothetical protein
VHACVCAGGRACVRECVRECVRACTFFKINGHENDVCVCMCVCVRMNSSANGHILKTGTLLANASIFLFV